MGLNRSRTYLDACVVIYFLEDHPTFGEIVRNAFAANRDSQFCISPLVELECLVGPLRTENSGLLRRYENFFQYQIILAIEPRIYRLAAELRARYRLKTPDALHLSTAQYHGCTEIWTNDNRLNEAAGSLAVNVFAGV